MSDNHVVSMVELPVPDEQRPCTDRVCAILGILFFLTMLGLAIGFRRSSYINKLQFSVDSDGKTCGNDLPDFPNLYFPNPRDFDQQLCVAKCPINGDQVIRCKPTRSIPCPSPQTLIDTERVDTQRGNYCLPKFESFRYRVIQKAGLVKLRNQKTAISIAKACVPLALCFGILFLVLVQFFPRCMVWTALVGAGLCLFALSLLVLSDWSTIWRNNRAYQIILGILLMFLGFTMLAVIYVYRGQIALCNILLKYASVMLRYYSPFVFVYIPIFMAITIIFMFVSFFQHNTFYNFSPPVLEPSGNYYQSSPNYPLVILNAFAFFWGLNFIRDSFSYVVSGSAVEWYFTHQRTSLMLPVKRMFVKNLGSIYGGSYLNTLFLLPSIIFDAVTCQQKGFRGLGNTCQNDCCRSFLSFVNIARKDAYAYINITGIQYCNAARECEQLCGRSALYPGTHSCLLPFRTALHLSSLLPVVIITVFYLMRVGSGGHFQLFPVLLVTFLSFCLLTFFIDVHSDVAEGLMICYFMEYELYQSNPNTNIWVGPIEMIQEIQGQDTMRHSKVSNISIT